MVVEDHRSTRRKNATVSANAASVASGSKRAPMSRPNACSASYSCQLNRVPASASCTPRRGRAAVCGSRTPKISSSSPRDLGRARQRVRRRPAELAVVQAGRVPAARCRARAARTPRGTPGARPCSARTHRPTGTARAATPTRGRDVLVELRRRHRLDVGLAARLALVVEAEHGPGRLDAVIDLGRRDHEPVAREPHRPAHRRLGELEDVGVEEDPRPVARGGRGDEASASPARRPGRRRIHV